MLFAIQDMEVFENWGAVPQNCWFQKVKTDGFCKKNGIPQNHRHIFPHNHRQNPIIIMGSPIIPILRNPKHRFPVVLCIRIGRLRKLRGLLQPGAGSGGPYICL